MAEGISSSILAVIQRQQRGELRSEKAIEDYLNGNGGVLEAFVASLYDAAKAASGPASTIPDLLMQTLSRQPEDTESHEAWALLKREAEGYGIFLQKTSDVTMSLEDKMSIFQAYVTPAVKRIGDWVIDHIIYPPPDEAAIEDYEGTPYIRGTRMKVRLIAEEMRAGSSVLNILDAHPHLTLDQVQAALGYYRAHQQEIDAQIDDLRRRSEELLPKGQTPSREQLEERLRQRGLVMTRHGLKQTA